MIIIEATRVWVGDYLVSTSLSLPRVPIWTPYFFENVPKWPKRVPLKKWENPIRQDPVFCSLRTATGNAYLKHIGPIYVLKGWAEPPDPCYEKLDLDPEGLGGGRTLHPAVA